MGKVEWQRMPDEHDSMTTGKVRWHGTTEPGPRLIEARAIRSSVSLKLARRALQPSRRLAEAAPALPKIRTSPALIAPGFDSARLP